MRGERNKLILYCAQLKLYIKMNYSWIFGFTSYFR